MFIVSVCDCVSTEIWVQLTTSTKQMKSLTLLESEGEDESVSILALRIYF